MITLGSHPLIASHDNMRDNKKEEEGLVTVYARPRLDFAVLGRTTPLPFIWYAMKQYARGGCTMRFWALEETRNGSSGLDRRETRAPK